MLGLADGKVTYIVAALTAIYAVAGVLLGKIDGNTAVQLITAALLGAGIRSGIETDT
jgi:hypothetical protein